jgi:hypothetical protein
LLSSDQNGSSEELLKTVVYNLLQSTSIKEEEAWWAVNTFAYALGITPSLLQHSAQAPQPPISPATLDTIIHTNYFSAEKLVDFLMSEYGHLYNSSIEVWEKYTLKEHTLMVLKQFEKYFSHRTLPGNIDSGFFRLIIALHDIGVPVAIQEGVRSLEFRHSAEIIEDFLKRYHFPPNDIDIATALVSLDPIGSYIKVCSNNKADNAHKYWVTKESYDIVTAMAAKCRMDINPYFELLLIFYMVDASSYTADAGGKYSLDWLFIFEPKIRLMRLAPDTQKLIDQFKRFLNPKRGCFWVVDQNWHECEPKKWLKRPGINYRLAHREVVDGVVFSYRKIRGKYQVKLKDSYIVAFYDLEN